MNCLPESFEQIDSTPMSLAMPSLLRVTTSLLNRSISRIWEIHQSIYKECCYNSKTMMSPSSITWQRDAGCRCPHSLCTLQGSREIPLDITINYVHITPDRKTEFQTSDEEGTSRQEQICEI